MRRNTIQREIVLNAVRTLQSHVSADEVYDFIHSEHPALSKGTVYRNLNIFAEEGEVKRVEIPNGPDRFDFTLSEHYHVQCVECGKVEDVDIETLDLTQKIKGPQSFKLISYNILFKGICADCLKNRGEN